MEHFQRLVEEEPLAARYDRGLSLACASLAETEERAGRRLKSLGLRRLQFPLAERCAAREGQSGAVKEMLRECRAAVAKLEGPAKLRGVAIGGVGERSRSQVSEGELRKVGLSHASVI